MQLWILIESIKHLADLAYDRAENDDNVSAQACLVRLREFLNEQPELEAGGSLRGEKPERSPN